VQPEQAARGTHLGVPAVQELTSVYLADEPTGELDTATGRDIIALLADVVRSQHVSLLVATHDSAVVAASDVAYRLVDGVLQRME